MYALRDAGTGMDEQRGAQRFQALEDRRKSTQLLDPGERACRQRDPDATALQCPVDVLRVRPVEGECPPDAERPTEPEGALVVGLEQRHRLLAGQALDPDRAGEAQKCPVEPVTVDQLGAARRVLPVAVDHVRALACQIQDAQAALEPDEGQLATARQLLDQRLAPEVLMDIGRHRSKILSGLSI